MKRAKRWDGNLSDFMKDYRYQPVLTAYLDGLGAKAFDQNVINEIVLWKVNRYANLSPNALNALNGVAKIKPESRRKGAKVLSKLLQEPGVDLPMASTFLRFRNADAFQIIDRHAYRAVYGEDYPLYSKSNEDQKIALYFLYLDELVKLAGAKHVRFRDLDRVLYMFDKQVNGTL